MMMNTFNPNQKIPCSAESGEFTADEEVVRIRRVPPTNEERSRHRRDVQHRGVLAEEEHGPPQAAIFRVVAADQLGFGFGKVERGAVRLGEPAM